MLRWIVGVSASLLVTAGAVLLARDSAPEAVLPDAPAAEMAEADVPDTGRRVLPVIPEFTDQPPEADPLSKEQKRFNRADRNDDEIITLSELVQPRRKRYANLDLDGDGTLSFEEWAITTIDKFESADADGNGKLTRVEYATTAPKPRQSKPACSC
ncbi:hypothetical protein WJT74_04530 [Sphingomicrobium sp. XHP0239]|uniref:hypothetical protein n=1 Tax=Sphingomicrobium maritimum TaxID=3133972 RepID=UPI0031CC6762